MGADTPKEGPARSDKTDNQMGDVSGAAVQAGNIDRVTINVRSADTGARPGQPGRTPYQVPPVVGLFVNRDQEYARIVTAAGTTQRVVRVVLVSGPPGVGKTVFTWHVAELTVDRYSGGQLYADYSSSPLSPARAPGDVLTGFLVELGVDREVIPASLAEKRNLYRTLTRHRDKPLLVVLDEVTEPAQIDPLVPAAPGSVVLVTSNDRFSDLAVAGLEPMPLQPLDGDHGVVLLAELVGDRITTNPDATRTLVEQCGGLPVALQLVGARLRAQPALTAARLVDEIADESRGLASFTLRGVRRENRLSGVFSLAYRALPDSAAEGYRQLGLLPVPEFTVELAAAATGRSADDIDELLATLVEVSLLTEDDTGRFRFHGLLRRHAREQAAAVDPETGQVAVLRRAVNHVLVWAAFADRAALGAGRLRITPHETLLAGQQDPFAHPDEDVAEQRGLDWLDRERATALAMVRTATDHGWFDAAWQLVESMTALFVVRRYLVDWTEFTRWGVEAARSAAEQAVTDEQRVVAVAAEARLRSFVSRPWTEQDKLSRAREELETASDLAVLVPSRRLRASIEELWGRWYDRDARHDRAQVCYGRAQELFDSVVPAPDERGSAFVQYFLGTSLAAQQNWIGALNVLRLARERIHAVGNRRMEGRAWMGIGQAHDHLGQDEDAAAALRAAVDLFADKHPFYEARAQEALADVVARRGDIAAAAASLGRAVALYRQLGDIPRANELDARLVRLTGK